MGSETNSLHILFFPLMAPGHLIPMTDIAKLFALRQGVQVSFVTTLLNATRMQSTIDRTTHLSGHHNITIHLIHLPFSESGLPEGCENLESVTSPDMTVAFFKAISLLLHPFEELVERLLPDCIVSDLFFPWTIDVTEKLNIPRLVFHGTSYFSLCVYNSMQRYSPHESVSTETDPFLVPKLPHPIEITKSQMADYEKTQTPLTETMQKVKEADSRSYQELRRGRESETLCTGILKKVKEADSRSYGVVVNSFYELEPDYAKHYRDEVIRSNRAWQIGPVSLCNRDQIDMAERGNKAFIDTNQCLDWLSSRQPGSVLYFCFGSIWDVIGAQLTEIALALEASGHPFIWVVRNTDQMGSEEEWMPDGFEERMKGKGLIIRGWAPQVMILNHLAVGGFVTHCGWNSVLEGVSAGVPMVTWPLSAEQFYNEKLITRVLRIGVEVGAKVWTRSKETRPMMKREEIEMAVAQLMGGGDEADERRRRARELGEMAKMAVENGGSSYMDLDRLIEDLKLYKRQDNC